MRRTIVMVATTVALVVAAAAPASAHGDDVVLDGGTSLPAGGHVDIPVELHYHRLVARVDADGPVTLTLVLDATGEVLATAGPGRDLRVNDLLRCCDDDPWADATLVLRNVSEDAVDVASTVRLVHDDLAVMVDGAEDGTRVSIVLLGAFLVWRLVRARRADAAPASLDRTVAGLAGLSALVVGLGVLGAARVGGGPVEAVVAGGGMVPVIPVNPIVSRASLLLGVVIFGWGYVATRWARAPEAGTSTRWRLVGLALAAGPILTAVAVASAYGRPWPPVVMAAVSAGPVLAVAAWGPTPPTVVRGRS